MLSSHMLFNSTFLFFDLTSPYAALVFSETAVKEERMKESCILKEQEATSSSGKPQWFVVFLYRNAKKGFLFQLTMQKCDVLRFFKFLWVKQKILISWFKHVS